jgi:hypothetical protein
MSEFVVKDSGQRREFSTGAKRDMDDNKPRPDLISPHALQRVGVHMAKGAKKYGDRNWEKGMPVSIYIASLFRHLLAYQMGLRDEDHMAAVMFNAQAILHFEERAKLGDTTAFEMLDEGAAKALQDELSREQLLDQLTALGQMLVGIDWGAPGKDRTAVGHYDADGWFLPDAGEEDTQPVTPVAPPCDCWLCQYERGELDEDE